LSGLERQIVIEVDFKHALSISFFSHFWLKNPMELAYMQRTFRYERVNQQAALLLRAPPTAPGVLVFA
jgi:hypothetical protein